MANANKNVEHECELTCHESYASSNKPRVSFLFIDNRKWR
jgi:hypothetical protein